MSGDVRPLRRGPTVHVDMAFREILENLDGALFVSGSARQDRFVILGDLTWAALSRDGSVSVDNIEVASAEARVTQRAITLAAGYTVVEEPDFALDLLAGARGWRVGANVDARVLVFERRVSETETWIDPIVAARMRADLGEDWSAILYTDVGGFGVGSDLTWQAVGTLNYQLSEEWFVSAGYRHMALDYTTDGLSLDVDMSGPLLGVTWRF